MKQLKPFWRQDGLDFIADLGSMTKAVVIRACSTSFFGGKLFYAIGEASYFPFTKELYEKKFDTHFEACEAAEQFIIDWLKELFNMELRPQLPTVRNFEPSLNPLDSITDHYTEERGFDGRPHGEPQDADDFRW